MSDTTLYWHDYETFGADPARDRPSQFAGLRTDLDLNPIGEPLIIYCQPAADMLPQPQACLVTGITPQQALQKGLIEAEFIQRIHTEFSQPGTCGVGYNSIRFDDEVTRYTLYRNFYDPYEREYKNGNSRWDIIDMVRVCYALRPEGIHWPTHPDGKPSFRLEHLTVANGISHESAHDALSDVQATIALAKLIRDRQPKLYDYFFNLRHKKAVLPLLNVREKTPVLHTSSMYSSDYGCTAMVVPVALHPTNKNGIIVYDLRFAPDELLSLSSEQINERLFTKTEDLPAGMERIPLKTVHINKAPIIAPLKTLSAEAAERLTIDTAQGMQHLATLKTATDLEQRIQQAIAQHHFEPIKDPDANLYGGFFSDMDRRRIEQVRQTAPQDLAELNLAFEDSRLPEMLFRYRARNWPATLSDDELARWQEYRIERLTQTDGGGSLTVDEFETELQNLASDPSINAEQLAILEELAEYLSMLM